MIEDGRTVRMTAIVHDEDRGKAIGGQLFYEGDQSKIRIPRGNQHQKMLQMSGQSLVRSWQCGGHLRTSLIELRLVRTRWRGIDGTNQIIRPTRIRRLRTTIALYEALWSPAVVIRNVRTITLVLPFCDALELLFW